MTQQVVCDECGKPIDQTQPYYELNGMKMQTTNDPPTTIVVEPAKTMHYHEEHLPHTVLEPAEPGIDNELPTPKPPPVDPPHPDQELPGPQPEPDNELPEPEPPAEPEDPYPGVVISDMTIQQVLQWAGDDQEKITWAIEQEVDGQNRRSLVDQLNNRLD